MKSVYQSTDYSNPVYVVKCLDNYYPSEWMDEVHYSQSDAMKTCVNARLFLREDRQWHFEVCFYPSYENYLTWGKDSQRHYVIKNGEATRGDGWHGEAE